MSEEPSAPLRSTLHGRRKGKPLRRHQTQLMADLLPQVAVPVAAPIADPATLFPPHVTDLWLEIGFGGGEHLGLEAARHPHTGFFGCEPFVNGVAKALALIEEHDLDNIRLHPGDAGELIDALPDASLSGIYILYPDPWPKRRQRKRRFVSDDMLRRLARVLKPGCELRFATDIDDYAGWVLARIQRSADFVWLAQSAQDWLQPWPHWQSTRYEEKARREGRASAYLTFVRR
ncbi:tRNA (guanosine(46)-N7)-methyltransferase TrmB [Methylovirgula sp. 4M-Z18]|uniref:tRNA (guanosine(46)-N7)-methyltransferase TrmB n=1 Tax=Methylovirgula sp. 4M-Z18 TaxID=2293567 RepID=UPI000E2EF811|nr:tRNA (guanosine(46)-N7)-methyltransferase TrmB [Methylovirgula sp. 4M-Z18]RFB77938.1 tRNA (guanosine(46)-N7)-methyltransferase TrmB [Methylovirgula sp. 4M-Z18]